MIDTIVLGPGGVKGFLELGTLYFLEKHNHLNEVKTYVGVSIGSLISLLICSGYKIQDILLEFLDIDINKSKMNITGITKDFGIMSLDQIKNKLEDMIIDKWGKVLNLEELYNSSGINYISVATNNDTKKYELISKDTFPRMSCVDASLASMTIPLIFKKFDYNGTLYTDGVISLPYPSLLLDDGKTNMLCIHVYNENCGVDNFFEYLYNNINIITNQMKEIAVNKCSNKCKLIFLKTKKLDIVGSNVNTASKIKMFIKGYRIIEKELVNITSIL